MRDPFGSNRISTPLLRAAIVVEGGLGLAACAIGWLVGRPPWEHIHWTPAGLGWGVVAAGPMLGLYAAGVWLPIRPLARLARLVRRLIRPMLRDTGWQQLALVSLAAGFGEELLFRGLIQPVAAEWLGPAGGLILASLLFGLAHPITRTYFVVAALIGLYLGCLWMATGALLIPILAPRGLRFCDFGASQQREVSYQEEA